MAKANVSRKWVNNNYYCCSVGYCDLQNLLYFQSVSYYTCGVYGWNFDVYTFGDYAITTGYRGMIDNVKKDYYSLVHEYEDRAKKLVSEYHELWKDKEKMEAKKEEVNNLLKEFLQKVFDTKDSNRFYIY